MVQIYILRDTGTVVLQRKLMFFSVVIPTYNRKPILEKCLLERQQLANDSVVTGYEIVGGRRLNRWHVDTEEAANFPHASALQNHQGPAAARNLGVECSVGDTIIFIDSDLVVTRISSGSCPVASARLLDSRKRTCLYLWSSHQHLQLRQSHI